MKLIIDIHEKVYKNAREDMLFGSGLIANAIKNGTPIEQEHCEDCISREAVIKTITEWFFSKEFHYTNAAKYLRNRLDELPSVTPQQKMGKWSIKRIENYDHAICSICGDDSYLSPEWDAVELYKYCPNCGSYNGGEG